MDDDLVERLVAFADRRLVAVPDTDGDVRAALNRLDELLGAVIGDGRDEPSLSPMVDGQLTPAARQALWRLSDAVAEAERGPVAQPVAPDGRYELVPLAWAEAERADLVAVGLAVEAVGRAWGASADEDVADVVVALAEGYGMKPEDLVAEAARLHGLLSLPWDADAALLTSILPVGAGRVVLDEASHAAYQRLVNHILGIWHVGDPFGPWLYRGR